MGLYSDAAHPLKLDLHRPRHHITADLTGPVEGLAFEDGSSWRTLNVPSGQTGAVRQILFTPVLLEKSREASGS